jgi:hypothetical protein
VAGLPELSDAAIAEIMNNQCLVSDAAGMYKKPVRKNMKPYEEQCVRAYNRIIDEWSANLLTPLAKGAYIQSTLVSRAWNVYFEGIQTRAYAQKFGPSFEGPCVEKYVRAFVSMMRDTSVERLIDEYGPTYLSMMWTMFMNATKYELGKQRRERIFVSPNHSDAKKWFSEGNMNMKLLKGEETAYGIPPELMNDIGQKISVIMRYIPRPVIDSASTQEHFTLAEAEKLYIVKVPKNIQAYDKAAMERYNNLVREWRKWVELHAPSIATATEKQHISTYIRLWTCFFEGFNTFKFEQHLNAKDDIFSYVYHETLGDDDVRLKEFLSFISAYDNLGDAIVSLGPIAISTMWDFITCGLKIELLRMKREKIFSDTGSDTTSVWDRWNENGDLVGGKIRPHDISVDEFNDVAERVTTILTNIPDVVTPSVE